MSESMRHPGESADKAELASTANCTAGMAEPAIPVHSADKADGQGRALPVMIQGTHSDAGKSLIATALCRVYAEDGWRTAPFKSQNMSLNSYITPTGKEIGRAQGVQAEAAGAVACTDMNPILIKPSRDYESQIVVHGKPYRNMKASEYRQQFYVQGKTIIREAYERLAARYERIVIEGAGSPAEINLNDRELVNMSVSRMSGAPVVLVGDIDRGGVFASLVGTLQLLKPEDRDRVVGLIINKFRGDPALLQPGLDWLEEYTGKPVLGVMPYLEGLHIEAEDSLALQRYSREVNRGKELDLAVIQFPRISNFTDLDPLTAEPDCHVRLVNAPDRLGRPDAVFLPGSKNTLEDLQFLRDTGLAKAIADYAAAEGGGMVMGICGGYQMLGERVEDPYAVESPLGGAEGLGLLGVRTVMAQEKTTLRVSGVVGWEEEAIPVEGYEIHMGRTERNEGLQPLIRTGSGVDGVLGERVIGTYFHDILHNDRFRTVLLNRLRRKKGLAPIENRHCYKELREQGFRRLAEAARQHLQLERLEELMRAYGR